MSVTDSIKSAITRGKKLFYDESRPASDLVDERLFFIYSMLNIAATPLHNAQPWRLFYARILELHRA